MEIIDYTSGESIPKKIVLHHGYDEVKEEPKDASIFTQFLIKNKEYDIVETTNPMEREMRLDLVTSVSDFAKNINARGEASISLGIFKGTGKLSFLNDVKFTEKNLYLLVTSRIISKVEKLKNLPFEQDLLKGYLKDFNKESFTNRYGNEYINQISYGGELFILFELSAETKEEKEEWEGKIKVKIGPFSGSVDFSHKTNEFSSQLTQNIRIVENGISKTQAVDLTDLDAVIGKASNFFSNVDSNSEYIVGFTTSSYNSLGVSFNELNPVYASEFLDFKNQVFELFQEMKVRTNELEALGKYSEFLYGLQNRNSIKEKLDDLNLLRIKCRKLYKKFYSVSVNSELDELFKLSSELESEFNKFIKNLPKQKFYVNFNYYLKKNNRLFSNRLIPLDFDDIMTFNMLSKIESSTNVDLRGLNIFALKYWHPNGAMGDHGQAQMDTATSSLRAISFVFNTIDGTHETEIYGSSKSIPSPKKGQESKILKIYSEVLKIEEIMQIRIVRHVKYGAGIKGIGFYNKNGEEITTWQGYTFRKNNPDTNWDLFSDDNEDKIYFFRPKNLLKLFGFYGTYVLDINDNYVINELFPIWN